MSISKTAIMGIAHSISLLERANCSSVRSSPVLFETKLPERTPEHTGRIIAAAAYAPVQS